VTYIDTAGVELKCLAATRGGVFTRARADRSAGVGWYSNGADRSWSEQEGTFGNAIITAELRYPLVGEHDHPRRRSV